MVTTFFPPFHFGGDGLFVMQLARDLTEAGHEVEVVHCTDAWRIVSGRSSPGDQEGELEGIRVHRLESRLGRLSPIVTQQSGRPGLKHGRLARILDRGFDVINFHNISLIGGPGVLRMGSGIKLYTLHEHWWVCPTHVLWKYTGELCTEPQCLRCCLSFGTPPQAWRGARGWMARCLSAVDLLLAPSRFTAERHRAWMEAAGVRVPLQICPEYTPALPPAERVPESLPARFFLYVGRIARVKGLHPLLDAFERRPDYPLVVVGEGDAEDELRARAPANVHFTGRVPRAELGAYYSAAEALVFPSVCAETFGLSPCEALSCGTPVVSSRCGGPEDFIGEDVGFLYSDEAQLLSALDRIWGEPELRQRLGQKGRERYLADLTPRSYLERYLAAIDFARETRA